MDNIIGLPITQVIWTRESHEQQDDKHINHTKVESSSVKITKFSVRQNRTGPPRTGKLCQTIFSSENLNCELKMLTITMLWFLPTDLQT